jgi:hypothetical protein
MRCEPIQVYYHHFRPKVLLYPVHNIRYSDFQAARHTMYVYIGCSFCRLVRRSECVIGRHCYLPANWRSFIRWSRDQWDSQCYAVECDISFYCALFCVFMTVVSQCPISLRAEHPLYIVYARIMYVYSDCVKVFSVRVTFLDCHRSSVLCNVVWNLGKFHKTLNSAFRHVAV